MADDYSLPEKWQKAEAGSKIAAGVLLPLLLFLFTCGETRRGQRAAFYRDSVATAQERYRAGLALEQERYRDSVAMALAAYRDSVGAAQAEWDRAAALATMLASSAERERMIALATLEASSGALLDSYLKVVGDMARSDPDSTVRAQAEDLLSGSAQATLATASAAADSAADVGATIPDSRRDSAQVSVQRSLGANAATVYEGLRVLWVDDRPTNNAQVVRTFRGLGMEVQTALSTQAALEALGRARVDLVISDMGRVGDPRAGYTLLAEIRRTDSRTPFLVYSASRDIRRHDAEVRAATGQGQAGSPQDLLRLINEALGLDGGAL